MSELVISTDIATRVKPTMASSPVVELTVRANGEERTKILDNRGNMFDCEIPTPTVAPVVITGNSTGNLPHDKWAAWAYVYAATLRYPNVQNANSYEGSLAPRGNPSPIYVKRVSGVGDRRADITFTNPTRTDINEVWIFRTAFYDDEETATTAGEAGLMFYVGNATVISHSGTGSYLDNQLEDGTDELELDNFAAPTFQFVWYDDPYWWGIGNFPFEAEVSWTTDGLATLQTPGDKWFNGRDGQRARLQGVTYGSEDGLGTFYFKWVSATTARLTYADGNNATLPSSPSSGRIVIQGPATTLYRSKLRNPFSWGETTISGDLKIPAQFVVKVGGGRATGIFSAPGLPYLIISTEGPAAIYSFDLRQAGTDFFEQSRYCISQQYSVSVHWSQFAATRQNGTVVLWGLDCKNFCIIECDGNSVQVVSDKISKTLRQITTDPSTQLLAHGCYEPYHQLNCLWFPTANSLGVVNWLVYQHVPTGNWYFNDDHDILCSATYQNPAQNLNLTFVGTAAGLVGQAFVAGKFWDWCDEQTNLSGLVESGTATSIAKANGFVISDIGLVGSWVLVTDANGEQPQWARVSAGTSGELTFDLIHSYVGGSGEEFNPVPAAGFRFYMGVIEISLLKYFNLKQPSNDKKLDEVFATLQEVDTFGEEASTFLRFYRDRQVIPIESPQGRDRFFLKNIEHPQHGPTDGWMTSFPMTEQTKVFGMEILDRGHLFWQMYDYVLRGKML